MVPNFKIEDSYSLNLIAGIDEAGRGPLCGPVVSACAAILDRKIYPMKIDDSKKLTEKNREKIFDDILRLEKDKKILFAIGEASVMEIEQFNIRNATKISMKRAYFNFIEKYNIKIDLVIVDGDFTPEINTKTEFIIKGDQKSISIATASIIAKVSRDKLLKKIDLQYPEYNWKKNKGYGTQEHFNAIRMFGLTDYHRKSFIHL